MTVAKLVNRSAPRRLPIIGARWTPAHVIRIDSQAGTYEEANPLAGPYPSSTELRVQRLLLTPTRAERAARKVRP